jgi:hypothetical protein
VKWPSLYAKFSILYFEEHIIIKIKGIIELSYKELKLLMANPFIMVECAIVKNAYYEELKKIIEYSREN